MGNATTRLLKDDKISLKLKTPFGANALILRAFKGAETISKPFEFELEMASKKSNLDFDTIIGKPVTVTIETTGKKRFFNGIVGYFSQGETASDEHGEQITYYSARVYPSYWLLRFKQEIQIFQNKSVGDILEQILKENSVDFQKKLKERGKNKREYCVQYNETFFDFLNRLMEEEGIYYFFKHSDGKHEMILADSTSAHEDCPNIDKAIFTGFEPKEQLFNVVTRCDIQQQVITNSFSLADYNFTTAGTKLYAKSQGKRGKADKNFYAFAGDLDHEDKPTKDALTSLTKVRVEAKELPERFVEGASTIPSFISGFKFQLDKHNRKDANKKYVLYTVDHEYIIDATMTSKRAVYKNTFKAFLADTQFRPAMLTPKPDVHVQTAVVTGPKGEEIWTDKYGRVKVQFHWDRLGKYDDKSTAWLRVRQGGFAGNNWGFLFLPRIGQEVIVEFFEGDVDRPFVTGALYNSKHMPPYLPDRPSKSTIKTNTTKGGHGYNELRFEDLKDEEQIYLHAQKDWDTLVLETRTTRLKKGTDWKWIERGDRDVTIYGKDDPVPKTTPKDEKQAVGKGDDNLMIVKGNRNMTLKGEGPKKGSYNIRIKKGDRVMHIDKGDEKENLDEGNHEKTLTKGDFKVTMIKGNKTLTMVDGNQTVTLTKGNQTITLTDGNQTTTLADGNREVTIDGNDTLTISENLEIIVSGDITITASGAISVEAGGDLSLSSGGDLSMKASGNVSMTAEGNVTGSAEGNMTLSAEGALEASAEGDMTLSAEGALEATAQGDLTIEGSADVDVTAGAAMEISAGADITTEAGGACEISAAADVSIEAASVTIEAGEITLG